MGYLLAGRSPVRIHQRFNPGVYEEVQAVISGVARALEKAERAFRSGGERRSAIPAMTARVFEASECQLGWARQRV